MTRRSFHRDEYDRLFGGATSSIFRLETLNVYDVPHEREAFEAFCRGEGYTRDEDDEAWTSRIRDDTAKGKRWQRVHVVDRPLSQYLRFEVETGYAISGPAGEEIGMIERDPNGPAWHREHSDFWLLDDQVLIVMRYSPDGQVLGRDLVEDEPDEVARCRRIKHEAIESATPYVDFCQ